MKRRYELAIVVSVLAMFVAGSIAHFAPSQWFDAGGSAPGVTETGDPVLNRPRSAPVSPKYIIYRNDPSKAAFCNVTFREVARRQYTHFRGRVLLNSLGLPPGAGLTVKVNTTATGDVASWPSNTTDSQGYFWITLQVPDDFSLTRYDLMPRVTNDGPEYTTYPDWGSNYVNFTVHRNFELTINSWDNTVTRGTAGAVTVLTKEWSVQTENFEFKAGIDVRLFVGGNAAGSGNSDGGGVATISWTPDAEAQVGQWEMYVRVNGFLDDSKFYTTSDSSPGSGKYVTVNAPTTITQDTSGNLSNAYFPGEVYRFVGTLVDEQGNAVDSQQVELKEGGSGTVISTTYTDEDGTFNFDYIVDVGGATTLEVNFSGTTDYLSSATHFSFYLIQDVVVQLSLSTQSPTAGQSVQVNGTLLLANSQVPITFRDFQLQMGDSVVTGKTDSSGNFSLNVQAPYVNGTYPIRVSLYNSQTGALMIDSDTGQAVTVVPPSGGGFLADFWWVFVVAGVAAAAVAAVFLLYRRGAFQRKVKPKKRPVVKTLTPEYLRMVEYFYRAGRIKEAVAYLFAQISRIIEGVKEVQRDPSTTARAFATQLIEDGVMTPEVLFPFVQKVEEVLYSGSPVKREDLVQAFDLFNKLYQSITNKPVEVTLQI
ncbi:MAG: hypothetical protein ACTSU5_03905 [Promethearchaeota archaeon]